MNKAERVRAARERADNAAAALAAFDQAAAAQASAAKVFHAKWQAFVKRSRIVIANLAGDFVQKSLAEFHAEFGYGATRPKGAKAIAAAIEGGAKIGGSGSYGQSYSLTGLAPRLRLLDKAQIRAVGKAKAKMDRAQAALNRATQEWKDAKKAAFEGGTKMSKDDLVAALVKREGVRLERVEKPDGLTDLSNWRRDELVRKVEQAGIHLTATRKGEECPCDADVAARRQAADAKAEAERIATLPKVLATCKEHGKRRMPFERQRRFIDPERDPSWLVEGLGVTRSQWVDTVPILRCPGGDLLVYTKQIAADRKAAERAAKIKAKADKAQARALAVAASKGAALPPPEDGDEIAFTCPGCGTVNKRQEVWRADDEDDESDLLVQCGGCGSEMLAAGVARLALEEGKAAA